MSIRRFINLVVEATASLPRWYLDGRPLTHGDLERLDSAEFIEGREWDYDWRLCHVPLDVLPHFNSPEHRASPPDAAMQQDDEERFSDIAAWYKETGIDAALSKRPIVLLIRPNGGIKTLDGFHRTEIARRMGATHMTASVAYGEPEEA